MDFNDVRNIWIQLGILLTMSIFDSLNPSFLELKKDSNKKPMPGPSQWVSYFEPAPAATSSHVTSVATIPSGVHASGGIFSYMNG